MEQPLIRRLAAVAVPFLLSVILGLHFVFADLFPPGYIFEPPFLLPFLNFIFLALTPLAVAYFAARSFLSKGAFGLLLLGCGVLAFGLAGLTAGWFMGLPDGVNVSVTIFNLCMLLSGGLHFAGAAAALQAPYIKTRLGRRGSLFCGYAGVFILAALLVYASMRGTLPRFFLQGAGPTFLRQAVLGPAVVLFFLSAFVLSRVYRESKSAFLYWYLLGLLLVGAGLLAVFLPATVGGVVGWAGRVSQYLGGVYFLVAVLSARTEKASIEETLADLFRRPAELYRSLFENSIDGIMLAAEDGRLLTANPQACEMLGYTEKEISHLKRSGIFDLSDPNLDLLLEDQAQTGRCKGELSFVRKDGSKFPAEISAAYFKDKRGETLTTLVVRDISERKEVEEKLRKAHEELELRVKERTGELSETNEALKLEIGNRKKAEDALRAYAGRLEVLNAELKDFAFAASHDLQEPLRKIQVFGDRLRGLLDGSITDEADDYLTRMVKAAGSMQDLLKSLLDYSRTANAPRQYEPVDLAQAVREALGDLEPSIRHAGAEIEVGDLPRIEADPVQLRLLFRNLIGNAVKYRRREEKPSVRISGYISGDTCHVFVKDNAMGFDEQYLDRIFKPFQRLHGKESGYDGTGMGLAVCRKIAERHGGGIAAQSITGKGSVFIVTLPANRDDRPV